MSDTLIIIPTCNERDNIEKLISEIFRYVDDINILIVDDNSPDGTGDIAEDIATKDKRVSVLHRAFHRGAGYAEIDAFKEALKRENIHYIIEMDADLSHDPKYISQFLKEIKHNDIVIGSRFIKGGKDIERNFLRRFFSKNVNFFIKKYLGLDVKDCSSGYRCFKRHIISSLDLDSLISKGPAILEEILYIAKFKNYKIKEIPIAFKARYKGKTKLCFLKLLGVFIDILCFKKVHSPESKNKGMEDIRNFGFRLALVLNILGSIMFYRQKEHFIWFIGTGCLILIFTIIYPKTLVSFKKILDYIIFGFGWMINVVSLVITFYLIFAPLGILFRLLRKDILNQKINKYAKSCWIKRKRPEFSIESYSKMG